VWSFPLPRCGDKNVLSDCDRHFRCIKCAVQWCGRLLCFFCAVTQVYFRIVMPSLHLMCSILCRAVVWSSPLFFLCTDTGVLSKSSCLHCIHRASSCCDISAGSSVHPVEIFDSSSFYPVLCSGMVEPMVILLILVANGKGGG